MKDDTIAINTEPIKPAFTYITCPNCWGYGAKGNPPHRITCPSCKGEGVLRVEIKGDSK